VTLRDEIVDNADWGCDNQLQIHYSQTNRWGGIGHPRQLPLYADCSAFVTCCYNWAGAPDPNGKNYTGGFTGTLLDNLPKLAGPDALLPADLVVFGPYPGEHVVVVVEPGDDPLCVSHGQEAGPIKVRLSVEARAHRAPVTCLRGQGLDVPAPPPPIPQEDDMPTIVAIDMVVNPDNPAQGYVLDTFGAAHPFGGAKAAYTGVNFGDNGKGNAQKLVITDWNKPAGYVLDVLGGIHPFGGLAKPTDGPYWRNAYQRPAPTGI